LKTQLKLILVANIFAITPFAHATRSDLNRSASSATSYPLMSSMAASNPWENQVEDDRNETNASLVDHLAETNDPPQNDNGEFALTAEQIEELLLFYTNEDFPTNLAAEFRAAVLLAEASISTDDLKDIFPKKCDQLIDQIGTLVRQEVSPILLDGARDIKKACPQWSVLSEDDRRDFWVAVVTSMALMESSCNNKAKNSGAPNGTAYGLWQGPKKLSATQGARWVLKQIESQIDRSGLLFWSNSNLNYWAVLNPNIHANKVKKILRKIPACVIKAIPQK
jgi:hypothetical protein